MKRLMQIFQERNGSLSSMRVTMFLVIAWMLWMFVEWRWAFRKQVESGSPDFRGLTELFLAMMVTFGITLISKIIQKKYEQDNSNSHE